jgi:hypothetical protein
VSVALNNITAPDEYDEGSTIEASGSTTVRLTVNNQSIYWQRGSGPPGGAVNWNEPEEFLPPGIYSFEESCDAVRVRAAVKASALPPAAKVAQVSVSLR